MDDSKEIAKNSPGTNHVLPLLRSLPPQLKPLKSRLESLSYVVVNFSSPAYTKLNLLYAPRLALVPIATRSTLSEVGAEIGQFKAQYPNCETEFIGVYSGRLPFDLGDLEELGVNMIYQSPLEEEFLLNRIFETAPIAPDHKNLSLDQLVRANITEIEKSRIVPFDLFLYFPMNQKVIFYLQKDTTLNEKTVRKFQQNEKYNLYIRRHDLRLYQEYSCKVINDFTTEEDMSDVDKSKKVASRIADLMNGFFADDEYSEDEGKQLLDNLHGFVRDVRNFSQTDIESGVRKYAYRKMTIPSHNQNVAAYCALFGMALGLTDTDHLRIGGLLHDIGKLGSANMTDSSPDYRLHPVSGALILSKRKLTVPKEVQDMVLYHHENPDGSGFPRGLKGEEIPAYAKVCAFANEFDKLTSVRPGYPQLSPAEAFRRIAGLDGYPAAPIYDETFHKPLLDKFLDKFPLGKKEGSTPSDLAGASRADENDATETINYGQHKSPSAGAVETEPKRRLVPLERLLKTEQFYRPPFIEGLTYEDPFTREEVSQLARQLAEHFKK